MHTAVCSRGEGWGAWRFLLHPVLLETGDLRVFPSLSYRTILRMLQWITKLGNLHFWVIFKKKKSVQQPHLKPAPFILKAQSKEYCMAGEGRAKKGLGPYGV